MSDSLHASLAALREAIDKFPDAGLSARELGAGAHDPEAQRWSALDTQTDLRLAGQRVLTIGSAATDDAVAFTARGARQVLVCQSPDELDPGRDGTFDLVHCRGLLHRVREPMTLLGRLRRMTSPGGALLIESMMLADLDRSEFLRFVPDRYAGDPTWWFVPGRLAFRWLVESAGFEVELEFGEVEGPRDGLPMVSGYLLARVE